MKTCPPHHAQSHPLLLRILGLRSVSLAFAALIAIPPGLRAQTVWRGADGAGGDGAWSVAAHWTDSLPGTAKSAQFYRSGELTGAASIISLASGTVTPSALTVGAGKTVTLNLASGARLEARQAISVVGTALGTGTGSANLKIAGPASGTATAHMASFYVGHNGGNGNTLTFSGPLTVTDSGTAFSLIGHGGGVGASSINNVLRVEQGASLTRYGLHVARTTNSISGNRIEVDDAHLTINGGGSAVNSTGLLIGNAENGSGNGLTVSGGGVVTVTTGVGGSEVNRMVVGGLDRSRSNVVSVHGSGSSLQLAQGTTLRIGISTGYGGNSLTVENGGLVDASGAVMIDGFSLNGGNNDGANRLQIQSGGTFTASATVANRGLIQLASGGALNGTGTLLIENGARFEAAGSGLGGTLQTTVKGGGVLAVGLTEAAAQWTLSTSVVMAMGSTLELNLFSAGSADQLTFAIGGGLDLSAGGAILKLLADESVLTSGAGWNLFGGNTAGGLTGTFAEGAMVLPELTDGLNWDLSGFNEQGAWRVAIIPEPGSYALMLAGLGAVLAFWRRSSVN